MTDVVSLAAELLALQSTTGSEAGAVDFVSRWLVARGWNVTLQEVTRGRANVWASRPGGSGGATFSTHLDTVPPYVPPRLEGKRLFGRGSSDAKGIAAAMMVASDRLASSGEKNVELLFVVGEEKGSDGARAANNLGTKSRFLINGEPTESKLASGAKGSLRATIRTRGREAHSAYPQLGRSAIEPMLELLPTIRSLPLPSDPVLGETTVNIGTMKGGTEANVIPAHAEAEIMFRLVTDVEPIKKMVLDWAKDRAEVEFGSHIPARKFATVPGFETEPVAYTSDIPLLSNWGEPFLFGPGSIHVAHTPDEYIDVDELRTSVDSYERLAKTLLAR
jgi:acetylornithine deacetylase